MTGSAAICESAAATLFVWRMILCWVFVGFVAIAWWQKEIHVKSSLPGKCIASPCNVETAQGCYWDPKNMTTACVTEYDDGLSTFESLLIAAFVLAGVEALLSPLHAGSQAARLNGILLIARVISAVLLACFIGSAARWAYFWFPLCGGIIYPVAVSIFLLMQGTFAIPAFGNMFFAFVAALFLWILYMADNKAVMNGWIPAGHGIAVLAAFATSLAARMPKKYSPPDSATERME
ncbi:unnamed protein product [Amoebophrya sp. A120]|nr:unnamed protein product [Amoebophrya sp. A120]|eukprot:GSA120T00018858001.1